MRKALALKVREIALDQINEPKGVIRLEIDAGEVTSLAESIRAIGLLVPINDRPDAERLVIVDGHRRFLAFKELGRKRISCVVGDFSDVDSAVARAAANLGRVDLSCVEEAAIYSDLVDNHHLKIDEIGRRFGKSGGVVKRRLDLLKMPPQLQKAVHKKQINYSVAEELWSIRDINGIDYYLAFAIDHGATQAVVRGWAKDWKDTKRREEAGTALDGGVTAPMEPRPVYIACDLCEGPMELGSETTFRICEKCNKVVLRSVKGGS